MASLREEAPLIATSPESAIQGRRKALACCCLPDCSCLGGMISAFTTIGDGGGGGGGGRPSKVEKQRICVRAKLQLTRGLPGPRRRETAARRPRLVNICQCKQVK